jgi:MFS family permease
MNTLRARLARKLPCYYGWVIFTVASSTSYASRPLMSVAVLSVFVVPMTEAFGWSRGLFSGAVSVGGLCAVALSPLVGRLLDKYGSGLLISVASAVAGACAVGLSAITQVWSFYALYVPGRMVFASPLELATTTALSNWFIRRRAIVLALFGVTQGTGLATMPLVAQYLIITWGWRQAWFTLGLYTLALGVAPALLFMVRRPEDLDLEPDPMPAHVQPVEAQTALGLSAPSASQDVISAPEIHFTLRQALRTRALWVLAAFSAVGFMAQAGVSLHQVSHYIAQGLPRPQAALTASVFAFSQVPAGLMWSALTHRLSVRYVLSLAGFAVALGTADTALASTLPSGLLAAGLLGTGVGGLHFLLRLAWAEYYGRHHLGAIRGLTLPVQIGGQALGPITAGMVFDATGGYQRAFVLFASIVALGSVLVLSATPPDKPEAPLAYGAEGV